MKMLKKLMAVALAGVMALVVLTGCAGSAIKTKEILANLKDLTGGEYTLEDVGEADAQKVAAVVKEFKAKEEYKDTKVENLIHEDAVKEKLKAELVPADNKDYVGVSYAKVEDYQSKYYTKALYNIIANDLNDHEMDLANSAGELGDTDKVSLCVAEIGDDTYVFEVIRTAPKK